MAQGYNKTVSSTKAVAPTMDISNMFQTNYIGNVQESTKYQPQEQSIDINIDEYMDIEIKPEEPKKAWYEQLWDAAGDFFSDVGEVLAATGATIAVGATSILSGVLDVGEHIVDGATWLVAAGADLVGADDAAKSMREFISRDLVDEANKAFYENTNIGKAINDASYMKYDSETAQGIRNVSEKVTVFAAATAATVLTGGGAAAIIAPVGLGFAYGAGEKAESVYQQKGTDTTLGDELGIFVSGVGEAANWYAQGKLGEGLTSLTKVVGEHGVKATASSLGNSVKTSFTNIKSNGFLNTAKGMFGKEQIMSNLKKSLLQGDNISDSVGVIGDNVAAWLNGDEEFNLTSAAKAGGELLATWGMNVFFDSATDYVSALNDVSSISFSTIDDTIKNMPTGGDYVEETALFGGSDNKKGFLSKIFGGGDSTPISNLSTQDRILRDKINDYIQKNGSCVIEFANTTQISSAVLRDVNDLSRLNVRINGGFCDLNGNFRPKYNSQKYINRITYTGYEALAITEKLEYLASQVDMSLPTVARAKQIYEILSSEIPVMRDFEYIPNGHQISASLRGLTDVNSAGKAGLVCAGYSQAYKELCTKCGIQCDYVRGVAYTDMLRNGRGGGHAWNIVIDGNNYVPVDVTWHASGGNDWFGRSDSFAKLHEADVDEWFKDYAPFNIAENISNAIKAHDAKYGVGTAIESIELYLKDGNINYITSSNGARNAIANTPISELQAYVTNYRQTQTANYVIDTMIKKYGYQASIANLKEYVRTGNPNLVTSTGDARRYVQQISMDLFSQVLGGY